MSEDVVNFNRILQGYFTGVGETMTVFPHCPNRATLKYDDVIKWKHFPRQWPYVQGIHRSPVNSLHIGSLTRSFGVFFDLRLNERLSK